MQHTEIPLEFRVDSVCSASSKGSESDYEMVVVAMDEQQAATSSGPPASSSVKQGEEERHHLGGTVTLGSVGAVHSRDDEDNGEGCLEYAPAAVDHDVASERDCIAKLKEMLDSDRHSYQNGTNSNPSVNVLISPEEEPKDSLPTEEPLEFEESLIPPMNEPQSSDPESKESCDTDLPSWPNLKETWVGRWWIVLMPVLLLFLLDKFPARHDSGGLISFGSTTTTGAATTTSTPVVVQDLSSFVAHERSITKMDSPSVEDFPTDSFRRYAVAMCYTADSFESAQKNLALQLSVVPEEISSKLLNLILVEGISQKNSIQDATTALDSDGQAQSYMAFWSTSHNPKKSLDDDNLKLYETCFLLAGISIKVADTLAGYNEETKEVIIGSRPCNCGYIYPCEACPILSKVTTKTPIFKPHSLTLKQQDELHRWMTIHALKSAESMLSTGSPSNISSYHNHNQSAAIQLHDLAWKKPSLDFQDELEGSEFHSS